MKDASGLLFIGSMFVGMGIGMLFDRAGTGTIIGMGVGFILMAIFRTRNVEFRVSFHHNAGRVAMAVIGFVFIAVGLALIFYPQILFPYLVAIGFIGLGVFLAVISLQGGKGKQEQPSHEN